LGVEGENTWPVPPLAVPALTAEETTETLLQQEAARLFVERAGAVKPDFALSDSEAPTVAEICQRLDGIPLAAELAAAKAEDLTVQEIYTGLEGRFRILTGGVRTALRRHQTMEATIDWSYDLLDSEERLLWCRLSVFAGGWTIEAAKEVCADRTIRSGDVQEL